MTDGRLVLLVSGPVPENEGSASEAAAGLLWELRHGAGVPVSAVLAPAPRGPAPADPGAGAGAGAAKGGSAGSIVELAVTGLFSAGTVAAIARVVVAFVRRGAARRIILRDGRRTLSITDPSEETERAVRDWLTAPDPGAVPGLGTAPDPASAPDSGQTGAGSGAG